MIPQSIALTITPQGMTRPGIEPQFPGPLANTLHIWVIYIYIYIYIKKLVVASEFLNINDIIHKQIQVMWALMIYYMRV